MKVLRAILIDDECIGLNHLRRLLQIEGTLEIVAECADGSAAVEAVRRLQPDLIFLDINMPGLSGFGVLDELATEEVQPLVIFVTAHDAHAVRAFEACALDYLLKPISGERLAKTIARAREHLAHRAAGANPESAAGAAGATRFVVRSGGRVSFVSPAEIDWVEAAGNYMILHAAGHNHMVRDTMAGMEAQLTAAGPFFRLSRSAIVHLPRVKELQSTGGDRHFAVLADGQRIPITRPLREVAERLAAL